MQKIKKIAIICILAIFITINTYTTSSASVEVTESNLINSIENLKQLSDTFGDIEVTLSEGIMQVKQGEDTYKINYELEEEEQPTFSYEYRVKQGMTYAEFEKATNTQILLLLGYIASANVQGVDPNDAATYILFQYLEQAFETSGQYVIVDDITNPDVEKTDNSNTIYASEFGQKAIEYINAIYPNNTQTISDQDTLNSYSMVTEKEQVSETTYKIKNTLTVNTEANYERLEGYANTMQLKSETGESGGQSGSGSKSGSGSGSSGTISGQNPTPSTSGQTYTENGRTITTLPYAGITKILITIMTITAITALLYATAIRRYKDIK